MADHVITLSVTTGRYLRARCSCGNFYGEAWTIELDDLNRLAHGHIEATEAAEIKAWGDAAFRSGKIGGKTVESPEAAYGVESAVTSKDEVIDLTTGLTAGDMTSYSD